ncbi:Armadillo/beta-catenin-like repeat-containing protein [Geodermatophilus pulveris]|uniref:Armadillo/beta-catenin-like repeat-containing protein n=1 Tax=Geodermatophilus pulveris TaxID=1564159 RepID=A0A239C5F1_9ACTN|nr:HEAT repeat domain-containing protein [Geodermatophilus pulveris]SNS14603.1 Armadillo/beta-catenin-like repeat-containing protein [Geodermatophilus pulveris]
MSVDEPGGGGHRARYAAEVAAALAEVADDPLVREAGRAARAAPGTGDAPGAEAGGDRPPTAVASAADRGAGTAERVAAVDVARRDAVGRPDVVDALIAVLGDRDDDPAVRRAALGALGELSFAVAAFAPHSAAYREALRTAVTAGDPALREDALEVLALTHDELAQERLVAGLRDPAAALVDPVVAIELLGYDLHAGHYDLLRGIVTSSTDPAVRSAAIRLLGGDSGSADLLRRVVLDRGEDVGVRAMGATALNALAPDEFAPIARGLALDPDEDDELRATSLTALAVGPGEAGPELADQVVAAGPEPSADLVRAAEQYREVRGSGG